MLIIYLAANNTPLMLIFGH